MKIRIGTRESKLAIAQTYLVVEAIRKFDKNIEIEIIKIKTTGDKILDKTLDKIGGKGLFVKELDEILMDGIVDITVHSYKDVPMEIDDRLEIIAVSKREDPRDVMILPTGIKHLDKKKPVGTSSIRRTIQFKEMQPELNFAPIRGNVISRIEKLDKGEFSAIILAFAGIKRLGLEKRVNRIFEVEEILPAACQGVIVVQAKKGFSVDFLKYFDDKNARYITNAERSFVKTLDGGCSSPVAAFGKIVKKQLFLTGFYVDKKGISYKKTLSAEIEKGIELGKKLAIEMMGETKN